MIKAMTLTEAKAKFSELINRITVRKEKITIMRKGKPVAIILPLDEYKKLSSQKREGLLQAKGSLAEIDAEINRLNKSIYKSREKEISRKIPL